MPGTRSEILMAGVVALIGPKFNLVTDAILAMIFEEFFATTVTVIAPPPERADSVARTNLTPV